MGERRTYLKFEFELLLFLGKVVEDVGGDADNGDPRAHYGQVRLQLLKGRGLVRPSRYCSQEHLDRSACSRSGFVLSLSQTLAAGIQELAPKRAWVLARRAYSFSGWQFGPAERTFFKK